jgi:tetratricopeptide (TPR) repeat protein
MTRRLALPGIVLCVVASTSLGASVRSGADVVEHLDAYLAGQSTRVVADLELLAQGNDLKTVLDGLRANAAAWIEAGGPAERPRRILTAATYALEAGRAGAFSEWKWVQREAGQNEIRVVWFAPPELIEWGCALLRAEPVSAEVERAWHLAALAAAQRAGDFEFLIGSPYQVRHNEHEEFEHLKHSIARVPKESRFLLGQAVAAEWTTFPGRRTSAGGPGARDAMQAYRDLSKDPDVGAEALTRLGALQMRTGRFADAVKTLIDADRATRDPYLVYLANYLRGEAHRQAKQPREAEAAYRRALQAVPRGQSASLALAGLLFLDDRRAEAAELAEAAVLAPVPLDPWREYGRPDDRFWPRLIAQLQGAIVQ